MFGTGRGGQRDRRDGRGLDGAQQGAGARCPAQRAACLSSEVPAAARDNRVPVPIGRCHAGAPAARPLPQPGGCIGHPCRRSRRRRHRACRAAAGTSLNEHASAARHARPRRLARGGQRDRRGERGLDGAQQGAGARCPAQPLHACTAKSQRQRGIPGPGADRPVPCRCSRRAPVAATRGLYRTSVSPLPSPPPPGMPRRSRDFAERACVCCAARPAAAARPRRPARSAGWAWARRRAARRRGPVSRAAAACNGEVPAAARDTGSRCRSAGAMPVLSPRARCRNPGAVSDIRVAAPVARGGQRDRRGGRGLDGAQQGAGARCPAQPLHACTAKSQRQRGIPGPGANRPVPCRCSRRAPVAATRGLYRTSVSPLPSPPPPGMPRRSATHLVLRRPAWTFDLGAPGSMMRGTASHQTLEAA